MVWQTGSLLGASSPNCLGSPASSSLCWGAGSLSQRNIDRHLSLSADGLLSSLPLRPGPALLGVVSVSEHISMAAEQGELQEQLDGGLEDAQVGAAGPDEVADAQAVPPRTFCSAPEVPSLRGLCGADVLVVAALARPTNQALKRGSVWAPAPSAGMCLAEACH